LVAAIAVAEHSSAANVTAPAITPVRRIMCVPPRSQVPV
jgi:hypothetical protein